MPYKYVAYGKDKQLVKGVLPASTEGLAIGTANTAGPDCPNENLEALYRHAHRYAGSS